MTKHERMIQRSALVVQFHNFESEFRQGLDQLKRTFLHDPLQGGGNYTAKDLAEWTAAAERFSAEMERKQGALFNEAVTFLTAAQTLPQD